MFEIKLARSLVFYVHDNRCGRDLSSVQEHSLQRIHQEIFANSWKLQIPRETPEKCRRSERIPWQFFLNLFAQVGSFHGKGRKCIIASDDGWGGAIHQNINSGNLPANILSGLFLEVKIELLHTTSKRFTIMASCKRLRDQLLHFITTFLAWEAKTRFKAAFGFGGSIKAFAKIALSSAFRLINS